MFAEVETVVSILTRLEGRVQPAFDNFCVKLGRVSILTRLEGRVQLSVCSPAINVLPGFNPHPTRRSGATAR